ncbi:MAG TPA: tRNA(His) guanylyltransferase Thg1 family protein [Candidatus Lokiarchaeia archaeon]
MDKTSLGNRMKDYEAYFLPKAFPYIPLIARLDGKNFHNWTKGLTKPFDLEFVEIMVKTTKYLVEESNAIIGYTQSDEISLIFKNDDEKSQEFFDGKLFKLTSVLASMCTSCFADNLFRSNLYNRKMALFDCRVFQVPNKEEAVNYLIWREQDAVRNSIQSVGQHYFSHNELHNKNSKEIQEMLWQKYKVNWNDLEPKLKRGTYIRRTRELAKFSEKEIQRLPEKHEAKHNPDLIVERSVVKEIGLPILANIENRIETIFEGKDPYCKKGII